MIPWVTTGNFLNGLIHYNESKKEKENASLLHVNTMDNNLATFKFLYHELVGQSQRTKNLMHVSLNFHENDRELLTPEFLIEIAQDFLFKFGFPIDQPHLIYEHKDKGHPHIHIAVPMTLTSGGQINNSFTAKRMIKIAREIEKKYSLHRVNEVDELAPKHLKEETFTESRRAIDSLITKITNQKPGSFEEMSQAAQKQQCRYNNEICTLGWEVSKGKNGITFFLQNPEKLQVSKGIKGSKLYGNLSLQRLLDKLDYNKQLKTNRHIKVKEAVTSFTSSLTGIVSLNTFKSSLNDLGIQVQEYYTKTGDVFGIDFIDGLSGIKFKGSELGKEFSWNSLKKKINVSKQDTFMVTNVNTTESPKQPDPLQEPTTQENQNVMTWKEEIEQLKREISLVQLAEDHGYVIDKKASTSTAIELKGADRIGIYNHSRSGDLSGLYYVTRGDSNDKGDIINFLVNKRIVSSNSEALKYLRNPGTGAAIKLPPKQSQQPKFKEQKPFSPVTKNNPDTLDFLIVDRGIEIDIVDKNFNGAVFTTTHDTLYSDLKMIYGNAVHQYLDKSIKPQSNYTVFPIYHVTDNTLVGQEIRNKGFKHLVVNSDKTNGVWNNYDQNKPKIAIFENPIDAISHFQLNPNTDTSYFGTMGNPSKVIINHLTELSKKHQTFLGGDNDEAGQYFNTLFIANKISAMIGKPVAASRDPKFFKISIEGLDHDLSGLRETAEALKKENPGLAIEVNHDGGKVILSVQKFDLTTAPDGNLDEMNRTVLYSVNEKLIYFYKVGLNTIQAKNKDMNEDLMNGLKTAAQKKNIQKI